MVTYILLMVAVSLSITLKLLMAFGAALEDNLREIFP